MIIFFKEIFNMKKTVRIKLTFSDHSPADGNEDLQQIMRDAMEGQEEPASEESEFVTDAEFTMGERCDLAYKESAELGMGDSRVKISWLRDDPYVITIMRTGDVETVMAFEPGRRHITAYNMPGMAFELCTHTLKCENSFDGEREGIIYLDYIIEIRGGFAGRRKMKIEMLPEVG